MRVKHKMLQDFQVKLPVTQMTKGQMPSDYQNPGNAQPYS